MINLSKKAFLTVLLASGMVLSVTGCGSKIGNKLFEAEHISAMDFNQKFTFKKPEGELSATPTILFLGNSYTYVNDLPGVFQQLSYAADIDADVYELTEGAYRLSFFADEKDEIGAEAIAALKEYDWDFVVLQEQSRMPTVPKMCETEMYPAARTLDTHIKAANAQTVFFMTWAYQDGDDWSDLLSDFKSTREEMQTQIYNSYLEIANELDALLSPCGVAFIRCAEQYSEIELWDAEDKMHSTEAGTYLAACTMFASIYNQSPVGNTFYGNLDKETALKLQTIAAELVVPEMAQK